MSILEAAAESAGPSTPRDSTLVDLLERASGVPGTGLRFSDRRERADFREWSTIAEEGRVVAAALLRAGIEPGDRVALVYPTCPDFFHAFFGILLAGAVPVPLYPPVRLGRLDEYHQRTVAMLEAASVRLLLVDENVRRLLGPTTEQARGRGILALGCRCLSELSKRESRQRHPDRSMEQRLRGHRCRSEDLALVQFSSGTTVAPKPVALSHRAVLAQIAALNSFWPDNAAAGLRHTGVSWLPLYHDMGLIGCVFPALERPSVLTLLGPELFVRRPALWLRAISTYGASISVAPNFAYGLCVEKIRDEDMEGVDLSSWRVALNGAEPVSANVLRSFQRRFARWNFRPEALTPVYGLSEATLAVTFGSLDRPFTSKRFERESLTRGRAVPDAAGVEMISVGRPLPGSRVRIASDSGARDEEGGIGRIEVAGPSIMEGYLDRPEATAESLREGWLDTGDLGFFHEGELFISGRAKDVVILRGRNYSPAELEQAVDGLPGMRTGCAVALSRPSGKDDPSPSATEELWLFVEHRQGATREERSSLPERCTQALLSSCGLRPDHVILSAPGTLPRTSSGKLRRAATFELHQRGELTAPKPVNPWRMAGEMLRSSLAHARARKAYEQQ